MLDPVLDVLRSPVGLIAITLAGYQLGRRLQDLSGGHAAVQPTLVTIVVAGTAIGLLGVDYPDYRAGTELIAFWMGPATVALAIPLHRQAGRLKGFVVPLLTAVVVGAVLSISSAVLLARALGADEVIAKTLGTKAATTPVAIALSEGIGGTPPLAAVFAIMIGIFTAILGPATLNLLRIRDRRARGLAVGAVAHGIGASRMLREDETEGAVAGLSMGLTALAISLVLPLLALWLF
ncbi:LrgB family protein [Nocardioides panacisoli]|uniref:LrgB family protein n=1 Tax=Nocardioides panacisoli TaxID=627624 RepID=UPI001C62CA56|nr:LrgB family protein [Nocardioides panacisoli]QYJ03829.1 LrgB family protein [Nocardioides panacisoli]